MKKSGIGLVVVACLALGACVPHAAAVAAENASYAVELDKCERLVSTCPGYVACRSRVAAAFGRPYAGRCLP